VSKTGSIKKTGRTWGFVLDVGRRTDAALSKNTIRECVALLANAARTEREVIDPN
jgi:hypothetical protein